METISSQGRGVLIYLRQEGRDIGLVNKIKAYELQRQGLDTVEANIELGLPEDARTYAPAMAILHDLKINSIILLTNNPDKVNQLKKMGIDVENVHPLEISPNGVNNKYLLVKKNKMGHRLTKV
jgi:3,4-dihydroxy 2-butanone 4-phosphate synthase/GTP cyclohydrolase II